jgi:predicted MFS family arabinose efflux permease
VPESFTRARGAVTVVFFLNGAAFASWYARLPDIQDRVGAGPGELGLALVGAPVGLLLAQPLAGAVASSIGSRPLVAAAPLWIAAIVLPALAVDVPTLALATFVVGAANGVLDIAMNVQGLAVERLAGRRMFNSFHAAFSFGALAGAGAAGVAAAAGVEPLPNLAIVAGVAAVVAVVASRALPPAAAEPRAGGPRFPRRSRRLGVLALIAFCVLLAEGAMFDWSGIYLRRNADVAAGLAPIGLAAFNLAMGFGRLGADRLADRLGSAAVGRGGALVAALGLETALVTGGPAGAILGFAVMGIGLAPVFPLALRAAGYDAARAAPAVAAVSTLGYAGFLVGPPTIGALAELIGLPGALACVGGLLALAAALAGRLTVRPTAHPFVTIPTNEEEEPWRQHPRPSRRSRRPASG